MRHKGFLAAVAAGLILVAGCSGGNQPPTGDKGAKTVKVRFVQSATELSSLPTIIALNKGFLKEQGVEFDAVQVNGGANVIAALGSGDAEFGQGVMPAALTAFSQGQRTLSVINFFDHFTQLGVIHRSAIPRGVSPDAYSKLPIRDRIMALKGKKLGIAGQGGLVDVVTRYLLQQNGLDPEKDVTIVSISNTSAMLGALQQHQIDAYLLTPPGTFQAVSEGTAVIFFDGIGGEVPELAKFPTTALMTTPEYAQKNPDVVKRVSAAYFKAIQWAKANQEESVKLVQAEFPKLDPEVIKTSTLWMIEALSTSGRFEEAVVRNQSEILSQGGILKKSVEVKEGMLWTNQFVPK
jgi:NitT/TauT family transport system substrate-binding protein